MTRPDRKIDAFDGAVTAALQAGHAGSIPVARSID
jgi:hypothetical protein